MSSLSFRDMRGNGDLQKLVDAGKYQVFLLVCPSNLPFSFGTHVWFVVNDHGTLSRWEVLFRRVEHSTRRGHLYRDAFAPFEGIEIVPYTKKYLWRAKLLGVIEGETAQRMGKCITGSFDMYPYREKYFLTGPNSNTYAQWILNQFPEFKAKLPWNAFGKNWRNR